MATITAATRDIGADDTEPPASPSLRGGGADRAGWQAHFDFLDFLEAHTAFRSRARRGPISSGPCWCPTGMDVAVLLRLAQRAPRPGHFPFPVIGRLRPGRSHGNLSRKARHFATPSEQRVFDSCIGGARRFLPVAGAPPGPDDSGVIQWAVGTLSPGNPTDPAASPGDLS